MAEYTVYLENTMKISFERDINISVNNTQKENNKQAVMVQQKDHFKKDMNSAFNITLGGQTGMLDSLGVNDKENSSNGLSDSFDVRDVQMKRNMLSVMSLSMSDEDYKEMVRTGQMPEDMDASDAVTVLDDIKAALIKGGVNVEGYTDDINKDVLENITGSVVSANALIESMQRQDVPVTDANVKMATSAIEQAMSVLPVSDSALWYLLENGKAPTIQNIYQASFAGEDISKTENINIEELKSEIQAVIDKSGLEDKAAAFEMSEWLMERDLPITPEMLNRLDSYENLRQNVSIEKVTESVTIAMSAGIPASDANLTYDKSIYLQAEEYIEKFKNISEQDISADQVHARRVLEEVRLSMTVEANRLLLRSNFQIDIAPMEELVDALKEAEKVIAKSLFAEDEESVALDKMEIYTKTRSELSVIPSLPAAVLGQTKATGEWEFSETNEYTLHKVYELGINRREAYVSARESYEALMTAPRADMGDSIRKAFANVDDILSDLGLDLSDDNRKAVRILGYNSMEITVENVEQIRDADTTLRNTLNKMTPSRVISMIRDNVNPLNMTLSDLNDYLDGKEDDPSRQAANYARFLMQLEKQDEITELERESYIGIYRMLAQLDKSDDAAIGRLLEMGMHTSFANMLSAMRSAAKSMDYKIDDEFAGVEGRTSTPRIDEQISAAFTSDQYSKAATVTETEVENLMLSGQQVSLSNIEAIENLKTKRGDWFKPLAKRMPDSKELESFVSDTLDDLLDDMDSEESMFDSYTSMLDTYKAGLSDMLLASNTYIDVKAIQSSMSQISLLSGFARNESYDFPVVIDGEETAIRLTLKHDSGAGEIKVSLSTEIFGNIAGEFSFAGTPNGYIAYDSENAGSRLMNIMDQLSETLSFVPNLVKTENINLEKYTDDFGLTEKNRKDTEKSADINNTELYRIAKEFISIVRHI